MHPILEVKNITKKFGGLCAVNNVSFVVPQGCIKAIIGPNGAGKSTLFNLIAGQLTADTGVIFFKDKNISNKKPYKIAKLGISRTFQTIKLFPQMSVLETVMLGRHIRSRASFIECLTAAPWIWFEEKKIKEKAIELLEIFKLKDVMYNEAMSLPFGKQRLVELARALATEPELLLLDEPASGLNINETDEFAEIIVSLKNKGMTIIIVEHDMSLVMRISDEVVVLNFGEKIAEGKPFDIQKNQEVINIYLGDEDNA